MSDADKKNNQPKDSKTEIEGINAELMAEEENPNGSQSEEANSDGSQSKNWKNKIRSIFKINLSKMYSYILRIWFVGAIVGLARSAWEYMPDKRPDYIFTFLSAFVFASVLLLFIAFFYILRLNNESGVKDVLGDDKSYDKYDSQYNAGTNYIWGLQLFYTIILGLSTLWILSLYFFNPLGDNIVGLVAFNRIFASISLTVIGFAMFTLFEFMWKTLNNELTTKHFLNAVLILLPIMFIELIFSLVDTLFMLRDGLGRINGPESISVLECKDVLACKDASEVKDSYGMKQNLEYLLFFLQPLILGIAPRLGYTLFDKFNEEKYKPDDMYLANILGIRSKKLEIILRGYNINSEKDILSLSDYQLLKWYLYSHIEKEDTDRIKGWLHALIIKHATENYFGYFYYLRGIKCVNCLSKYVVGEGVTEGGCLMEGCSTNNQQDQDQKDQSEIDEKAVLFVQMSFPASSYHSCAKKIKVFESKTNPNKKTSKS